MQDPRILIANVVAAIIVIVSLLVSAGLAGEVKDPAIFNILLGAAVGFLFTENVVNGRASRPEVIDL